jgi:hypothetical protein
VVAIEVATAVGASFLPESTALVDRADRRSLLEDLLAASLGLSVLDLGIDASSL